MLLNSVWKAYEAKSLLSVVDSRLLQTLLPSRSDPLQDESISTSKDSKHPPLPSNSHNLTGSGKHASIVVDVRVEVQKTLWLGHLCCFPNPKAQPPRGQLNGILQQIQDMKNAFSITYISMPSLPENQASGTLPFTRILTNGSLKYLICIAWLMA